jgi:uncharacterized membrane protein
VAGSRPPQGWFGKQQQMFDQPFDFLSLIIAIAALIFARKASSEATGLRARLETVEAAQRSPAPAPPPLPEAAASVAAPPPDQEAAASVLATEPVTFGTDEAVTAPEPAPADTGAIPPPLPPPPSPSPAPGFEERLGTRWVVWIGGLTLALGGFFMVRYSIEAGLLGPGVRTLLGGAFALALLAAGEATRRKESVSAIAALPIANIPAILTAAGTAVAFATVYAA